MMLISCAFCSIMNKVTNTDVKTDLGFAITNRNSGEELPVFDRSAVALHFTIAR